MNNCSKYFSILTITLAVCLRADSTVFVDDVVIEGKLGIGVEVPQTSLHLGGSIRGHMPGGAIAVQTEYGWTSMGAQNAGWSHFSTDRPLFYFHKPIVVNGGQVMSYNEDLLIRANYRKGATREQLFLSTSGRIGINTATPTETLDVNGNLNVRGAIFSEPQGDIPMFNSLP